MTFSWKHVLIFGLVCLAGGAYLGSTLTKPKEVVKTQLVDHDVTVDHVVTQTKVVYLKDGSKEVDTTVTDDKKQDDVKKEVITDVKPVAVPGPDPKWFVTVGAGLDASSLGNLTNPVYQLGVDRRILGPIFGGVWVNNKTQAGVELGLEF